MTEINLSDTTTWLPLDGLAPGFDASKAEPSDALVGRTITLVDDRGTRISHNRLNEAVATDASGVAVGCPFCVTMFEDGVRALNVEERFAVKDIAELVVEALPNESQGR